MQTRAFGKTGLNVTALGFGAPDIGVLDVDAAEAGRLLNELLDLGVNVIDTAAVYGSSEEIIGGAISHRRDQFALISKCGAQEEGLTGAAWSPELIANTIDRALQRLRTDRLEVMVLHSCDLETLERGEALGALLEAKRAGKLRHVGYSGDNEAAAHAAGMPDVEVIETSVNLCDQANLDGALTAAGRNGKGVIAKRPIANAAWKDPDEQLGIYVNYSRPYHERLGAMGFTPGDFGFPDDSPASWAELALRFTLSFDDVHTAIIGTTNPGHLRANAAAVSKGPLPREVIDRLRAAFRRAEAASGEKWSAKT